MSKIILTESDIRYMVYMAVQECVQRNPEMVNEFKLSKVLGAAALGGALMFGHPTNANAQLNIKSQDAKPPVETVQNNSFRYRELVKDNEGYKLVLNTNLFNSLLNPDYYVPSNSSVSQEFMKLRTDYLDDLVKSGYFSRNGLVTGVNGEVLKFLTQNRGTISIFLGSDEKTSISSLKQMMEFISNNEKTTISQNDYDIVLVSGIDIYDKNGTLYIFQNGIEGAARIHYRDIEGTKNMISTIIHLKNMGTSMAQIKDIIHAEDIEPETKPEEEFTRSASEKWNGELPTYNGRTNDIKVAK